MNNRPLPRGSEVLLSREIDDLLLDIRGLALVRGLLAERGASNGEIESHTKALERRRRRLVDLLTGRPGGAAEVRAAGPQPDRFPGTPEVELAVNA